MKTLENISKEDQTIFNEFTDPVLGLTQCQTIDEIYIVIRDIYKRICIFINKNKKKSQLNT